MQQSAIFCSLVVVFTDLHKGKWIRSEDEHSKSMEGVNENGNKIEQISVFVDCKFVTKVMGVLHYCVSQIVGKGNGRPKVFINHGASPMCQGSKLEKMF